MRGGVLKLRPFPCLSRRYYSSPCGEVYWNLDNDIAKQLRPIPPRAGRCIEMLKLLRQLKPWIHSSPCGGVYWNSVAQINENTYRFLPVRGGVLKFGKIWNLENYFNSSPCGEVYWNMNGVNSSVMPPIPPCAGRCIEIFDHDAMGVTINSSPCGEVYWNLPSSAWYMLKIHSSPCGEVYWNWELYDNRGDEEFLPVWGGVLKFTLLFYSFQPVIPPRVGRCIEMGKCSSSTELENSSPWGEVYWNYYYWKIVWGRKFLPMRGGVLK